MSYNIRINVLINGKRLSACIRSETDLKELYIFGLDNIKSLDNIISIDITKDFIILTKEDRAFRDGMKKTVSYDETWDRRINNIEAYDWEGKLVWNIGDIVGNIHRPFWGGIVIAGKDFEKVYGSAIPEKCQNHDLLCCAAFDMVYVIDLTSSQFIGKYPEGR
jgi:hypothetical protein